MPVPHPETLLQIWEDTRLAHPIRRALALLDAGWPEVGGGAWVGAPVGRRDTCLVHFYGMLFGSHFHTAARCPSCGEQIDATFTIKDTGFGALDLPGAEEVFQFRDGGYELEYRLPSSDDLLTIAADALDAEAAQLRLVERCVRRAMHLDRPVPPADLPGSIITGLAEGMAERDPAADMRVDLECPACRNGWSTRFDIVVYASAELDDWAQRLLADTHALALAYGWSEREIVGLSPARRQLYLEMIGA